MDLPGMVAEIKDEAKRRIASPVFGAYALAWCAFNYRLLIVLFSDGNYEKKITYITTDLYASTDWRLVFGLPALASATYVLVSPMLTVAVDLWIKWVQVQGDNLTMWAETKRWQSDEELLKTARNAGFEADSLRRRAMQSITDVGDLTYRVMSIPGHDVDVKLLKLTGLRDSMVAIAGNLLDVIEQAGLPHEAYAMLKLLSNHGFQTEEQLLRDGGNTQTGSAAKTLAFLQGAKLIELIWKNGASPGYRATSEGRQLTQVIAERYSHEFS